MWEEAWPAWQRTTAEDSRGVLLPFLFRAREISRDTSASVLEELAEVKHLRLQSTLGRDGPAADCDLRLVPAVCFVVDLLCTVMKLVSTCKFFQQE